MLIQQNLFSHHFLAEFVNALQIWRYDDPLMGPRKIPIFQDYKKDKTLLGEGSLTVDVEKKLVSFKEENGVEEILIGRDFIYVVE